MYWENKARMLAAKKCLMMSEAVGINYENDCI